MAEKLPEKLNLEIVTPSRQVFAGEVDAVTVPGRNGYLGILPGHAPLLSELKAGVLSYVVGGVQQRLYCGWGFVEVLPDRVSVLAEEAELPEEIDVGAAAAEKAELESAFRRHEEGRDYARLLERWEAMAARLEAAGGRVS